MAGFDPNADYTSTTQAGGNITDDGSPGLYGVPKVQSAIPITLKRGVGDPNEIGHADAPAAYTPPAVAPYEEVLKLFYDVTPNQRAGWQQLMYQAGLYPAGYYVAKNPDQIAAGQYDDDSYEAWSKVVRTAARAEKTPEEVLNDLIGARNKNGGAGGAGSGVGRDPFSPVVTNPLDIRDTAQVVAKKTLGRQFSDDELSRFVGAFQGMETGAQATNYNATAAGGQTVAAPSMQAAAENAARTAAPAEAGAHDLASVYENFLSLLGGTG